MTVSSLFCSILIAIELGFEQPTYTVGEDEGVQDNLVFVIKVNNTLSEQILSVNIERIDPVASSFAEAG